MIREETNRDMEEIKEIMKCNADIETKYKMISNILTAKPHYFEKQELCEDCISREELEEEIEKLKSRRFQDFMFGFFCGAVFIDLMTLVFSFIKYVLMR